MSDFVALYTPSTWQGVRWYVYEMHAQQVYDMYAKFTLTFTLHVFTHCKPVLFVWLLVYTGVPWAGHNKRPLLDLVASSGEVADCNQLNISPLTPLFPSV